MSKEIVFRLEATFDKIHGKIEGGVTVDLRGGEPRDFMQMLFTAMHYKPEIAAMINGVSSLYKLERTQEHAMKIETAAFLTLMRRSNQYCREITAAVVEFWQATGINLGELPDVIKRDENQ